MKEYKLCYCEQGTAYFTSQPLKSQRGDDWNDAPYEHNAGTPYKPSWHREGGKECSCSICEREWDGNEPRWDILEMSYGDRYFKHPCDGQINSPWSVEQINNGEVPWLESHDGRVQIYAGVSPEEFVTLCARANSRAWQHAGNADYVNNTEREE